MNTLTWKFAKNMTGNGNSPTLTLNTIEETLAYLSHPPPNSDKWRVCSIPLCDFMDGLEADGFVYNLQALRAFEAEHNLAPSPENGSTLSYLVYTCQQYRRARKLEVEGWEVCSPDILEEALRKGMRLVVRGESALGGQVDESFNVRVWKGNGKPCAFRQKKQKPLKVSGLPCKLVA